MLVPRDKRCKQKDMKNWQWGSCVRGPGKRLNWDHWLHNRSRYSRLIAVFQLYYRKNGVHLTFFTSFLVSFRISIIKTLCICIKLKILYVCAPKWPIYRTHGFYVFLLHICNTRQFLLNDIIVASTQRSGVTFWLCGPFSMQSETKKSNFRMWLICSNVNYSITISYCTIRMLRMRNFSCFFPLFSPSLINCHAKNHQLYTRARHNQLIVRISYLPPM